MIATRATAAPAQGSCALSRWAGRRLLDHVTVHRGVDGLYVRQLRQWSGRTLVALMSFVRDAQHESHSPHVCSSRAPRAGRGSPRQSGDRVGPRGELHVRKDVTSGDRAIEQATRPRITRTARVLDAAPAGGVDSRCARRPPRPECASRCSRSRMRRSTDQPCVVFFHERRPLWNVLSALLQRNATISTKTTMDGNLQRDPAQFHLIEKPAASLPVHTSTAPFPARREPDSLLATVAAAPRVRRDCAACDHRQPRRRAGALLDDESRTWAVAIRTRSAGAAGRLRPCSHAHYDDACSACSARGRSLSTSLVGERRLGRQCMALRPRDMLFPRTATRLYVVARPRGWTSCASCCRKRGHVQGTAAAGDGTTEGGRISPSPQPHHAVPGRPSAGRWLRDQGEDDIA